MRYFTHVHHAAYDWYCFKAKEKSLKHLILGRTKSENLRDILMIYVALIYLHSPDSSCMVWPLARYEKVWVAHAPGMPGTFSPPPRVSNPDMHHGTCVPDNPGACATCNVTYLVGGPWRPHPETCSRPYAIQYRYRQGGIQMHLLNAMFISMPVVAIFINSLQHISGHNRHILALIVMIISRKRWNISAFLSFLVTQFSRQVIGTKDINQVSMECIAHSSTVEIHSGFYNEHPYDFHLNVMFNPWRQTITDSQSPEIMHVILCGNRNQLPEYQRSSHDRVRIDQLLPNRSRPQTRSNPRAQTSTDP